MDTLDRFLLKVKNLKKLKSKELRISAQEAESISSEIQVLKAKVSSLEQNLNKALKAKPTKPNSINIDGNKF